MWDSNNKEKGLTISDVGPSALVVMVGAFPPPLHGMSAMNAAVRQCLQEPVVTTHVLDLAAPSLSRSTVARLGKLPGFARAVRFLVFSAKLQKQPLYMSVSGGFGRVYELCILLLARLRRMRIFLHHHTFSYLDKPDVLGGLLTLLAGRDAMHILLSEGMCRRYRSVYRRGRIAALSNSVLLTEACDNAHVRTRRNLRTIGFIGNIASEKGIFDFLDVMERVGEAGWSLSGRIAGPFQDKAVEHRVRSRLDTLPHVDYLGPRYGSEKDEFFASIDVLLFPTRYVNEAEPLVIHEAQSHGIPVIAYGRGSISEIVADIEGTVIHPADEFVEAALRKLREWASSGEVLEEASRASRQKFDATRAAYRASWQRILAEIKVQDGFRRSASA